MDRAVALFIISLYFNAIFSDPSLKSRDWNIYSFHINTTVTSRYAITVITSRVVNLHENSTEINFHVKIPKTAFISKFRMTIDDQTYDGVVKEKEEATQQYSKAVSRGESAAIVSSVGRTLEDFKTSVTVAAHKKVTFELTYEELLQRRHGRYELLINAQPGQLVKDFKIDVNIYEKPGISFLEVKGSLGEKDLANAITTTRANKQAWVNFYPTRNQQMSCDDCGETGLNGDLKILYDVNRPQALGDVTEDGGYFVHFFAPTNLPRIPKNVVFIIDVSGSMMGKKIEQTREALLKILDDLAGDDYFGLILFHSRVSPWKHKLIQATQTNVNRGKTFVRGIEANGGTNINDAVLKGVEMVNNHPREGSASILILLTDGDPTTGETNQGRIQSNVREAIGKKFPLYCLGFGFDVKFEFLQKMAQENSGVARRIYEASDAALQLKGFYEEVATPLLTSIEMNYTGAANLTQTTFSHYYNGSEIVVAGKILDNNINGFSTEVIATSKQDMVKYSDIKPAKADKLPAVMSGFENFLQRLWACLTVKQLLGKELILTGEEKEAVKKQALDLSLKYSFVTPLTSMVVTKPEGEDSQVADKPKEGEKPEMSKGRIQGHKNTRRIQSSPPRLLNRLQVSSRTLKDGPIQSSRFQVNRRTLEAEPIRIRNLPSIPKRVRFLMAAEGQSLPLCFDIPADCSVKLLQDPGSGFSMNGKLMSDGSNGFSRIVVHVNADQHIELDTRNITVKDRQDTMLFAWTNKDVDHTTDSMTLFIRDNEVDITMATIRIVILLHQKDQTRFLWPAVRNHSPANASAGIIGKQPVAYEEVQPAKLRIQGQEVNASSDSAQDFSLKNAPKVRCQLVELKFALQGELSDFTVLQL